MHACKYTAAELLAKNQPQILKIDGKGRRQIQALQTRWGLPGFLGLLMQFGDTAAGERIAIAEGSLALRKPLAKMPQTVSSCSICTAPVADMLSEAHKGTNKS